MTSIDFRVPGMDTEITARQIESDSFATQALATASIDVTLANIQTIFFLKTADDTGENLQCYVDRTKFNTYLDLSSATMSENALDGIVSDGNRFTDDYLRYVALKIFNSTNGTDLFSNNVAVKTTINSDFKNNYDHLLSLIDMSVNTTSTQRFGLIDPSFNMAVDEFGKYYLTNLNTGSYNIVYFLFKQLQQKQPDRASSFLGTGNVDRRAFPFIAGDSLTIYLTIKPNELQSITSTAYSRIENKTYAIKINVIADEF